MVRRLLLLLLVLATFVSPTAAFNADWSQSESVSLSYGQSISYMPSSNDDWTDRILGLGNFRHRFTNAQILSNIIFKNTWYSSLSYTKNDIVLFTAYVNSIYYGSGTISVVEQLDGDIHCTIDFDDVDVSFANSLTGVHTVSLSYDSSVWNGVSSRGGNMVYYTGVSPFGLTVDKPTALYSTSHPSCTYSHWSSLVANTVQVSYNVEFTNNYSYGFNNSYNISMLDITRPSSTSIWNVYDSTDFVYFADDTYSTTSIDQSFSRQNGVYANITFNVDGGTSIYRIIDINSTVVEPDAPPGENGFEYNITTELDEYSPGDTVNVTYTTDQKGTIQVVKTISSDIYHSIGFISGATNATWQFYIAGDEPYGFYDVHLLDSSNTILDTVRYVLLPSTSSLDILQSSVDLHETFVVFAQTVNESILSIEDPGGVEVWNETINALMYDYIYYTPTIKTGIYTAYLYDDSTLNDTVMVYLADPPIIDDPLDPETNGSIVVEDVLEDDETMTVYFDDKFRGFAPTAWGIFLLAIVLWLMAILSSFGGSSKRR